MMSVLFRRWKMCIAATLLAVLPSQVMADLNLPVVNGVITSGIGWRVDPFGTGKLVYHRGIDIAVPTGTPVHATRGGRVLFAGKHGGHGTTVIIEDDNGNRTLYGHNSSLSVRQGERVEPGTVVALSGNSGRSTGPHIHYETIPSGRAFEITEASVPAQEQNVDTRQRQQQEQRMEEAVNSILRRIREPAMPSELGQGG